MFLFEVCILLSTGTYLNLVIGETSPSIAKDSIHRLLGAFDLGAFSFDPADTTVKMVRIDEVPALEAAMALGWRRHISGNLYRPARNMEPANEDFYGVRCISVTSPEEAVEWDS